MPYVVHVKKARKARRKYQIRKGDEYWMVSQRISGRFVRKYFKRKPKPSELTTSEFWRNIYQLREWVVECRKDGCYNDAYIRVEADLNAIQSDLEDKIENVPDSLRDAPTTSRMQERRDAISEAAANLPGELEEGDGDVDGAFDELENLLAGISCE